ncbi:hypothetical protein EQZ23_00545 [Sphingomonas sp. UV9]|uniref:hypothetical protein n=1 Tax=Sphingomonas sp. UV9 TaxID=1851410 RepID=UPI000FFBA927|nr:hypothetical protein [Sphingomonas sp. UV9]RXD06652.1 hypothetical protein EQZ23_00545 [Sphingomonas sp. UV9]
MTDHISKPDAPCPSNTQQLAEDPPPQVFLRMRPGHFFSNRFDLEIVEDHSKLEAESRQHMRRNWLARLMELNLLLLILLVGIPVLAYCVFASTG